MSDTIVFDIETQNFFTDPEVGADNFSALRISVVGAYSYAQNAYFTFEEHEVEAMAKLFRSARLVVGFSSNRYDIPVLNCYFQRLAPELKFNLWHLDRVDLLEEIEMASGERISLSRLSEANLGVAKDRHGSEAIWLYRTGQMDELKQYCLKDVELTKQLYDLYRDRGYFFVPDKRSGEITKLNLYNQYARTAPLF